MYPPRRVRVGRPLPAAAGRQDGDERVGARLPEDGIVDRVRLTPNQIKLADVIREMQRPCSNCGRDAMSVKFAQPDRSSVQVVAQCDECGEWRTRS